MSRYDGLIIPRSYSEYINKTDAATLQQALQLSGVLSGAVAAGDNKAVTSNAVKYALENYEVKQNIGFLISRTTYKISFPKGSYLKIITRGCEEVAVFRGSELKAFRNYDTYTKVDSINYADDYLYVTIKEYAEQTYILTNSIKTIETSTIPTTVTNIPITEIATKSELVNYIMNAESFGEDKTTSTKVLSPGVYLFLSNMHPLITADHMGIYAISVCSQPDYNKVITYIQDVSLSEITISKTDNTFKITTRVLFRGALIKLRDCLV